MPGARGGGAEDHERERSPVRGDVRLSALALLDIGVGNLEQAASELSTIEQEARVLPATPDASPWADLCEVLVRLGRRDEARTMSETFAPVVGVGDHHWVAALRERSAGLLASEEQFDEHFDAALTHRAHRGRVPAGPNPTRLRRAAATCRPRRRRARAAACGSRDLRPPRRPAVVRAHDQRATRDR